MNGITLTDKKEEISNGIVSNVRTEAFEWEAGDTRVPTNPSEGCSTSLRNCFSELCASKNQSVCRNHTKKGKKKSKKWSICRELYVRNQEDSKYQILCHNLLVIINSVCTHKGNCMAILAQKYVILPVKRGENSENVGFRPTRPHENLLKRQALMRSLCLQPKSPAVQPGEQDLTAAKIKRKIQRLVITFIVQIATVVSEAMNTEFTGILESLLNRRITLIPPDRKIDKQPSQEWVEKWQSLGEIMETLHYVFFIFRIHDVLDIPPPVFTLLKQSGFLDSDGGMYVLRCKGDCCGMSAKVYTIHEKFLGQTFTVGGQKVSPSIDLEEIPENKMRSAIFQCQQLNRLNPISQAQLAEDFNQTIADLTSMGDILEELRPSFEYKFIVTRFEEYSELSFKLKYFTSALSYLQEYFKTDAYEDDFTNGGSSPRNNFLPLVELTPPPIKRSRAGAIEVPTTSQKSQKNRASKGVPPNSRQLRSTDIKDWPVEKRPNPIPKSLQNVMKEAEQYLNSPCRSSRRLRERKRNDSPASRRYSGETAVKQEKVTEEHLKRSLDSSVMVKIEKEEPPPIEEAASSSSQVAGNPEVQTPTTSAEETKNEVARREGGEDDDVIVVEGVAATANPPIEITSSEDTDEEDVVEQPSNGLFRPFANIPDSRPEPHGSYTPISEDSPENPPTLSRSSHLMIVPKTEMGQRGGLTRIKTLRIIPENSSMYDLVKGCINLGLPSQQVLIGMKELLSSIRCVPLVTCTDTDDILYEAFVLTADLPLQAKALLDAEREPQNCEVILITRPRLLKTFDSVLLRRLDYAVPEWNPNRSFSNVRSALHHALEMIDPETESASLPFHLNEALEVVKLCIRTGYSLYERVHAAIADQSVPQMRMNPSNDEGQHLDLHAPGPSHPLQPSGSRPARDVSRNGIFNPAFLPNTPQQPQQVPQFAGLLERPSAPVPTYPSGAHLHMYTAYGNTSNVYEQHQLFRMLH